MTDLQILQKINKEDFIEFINLTLKTLNQKQSSSILEKYKAFCSKCDIELAELESSIKIILQGCKDVVKKGKPVNQLLEEFRKLGMNEEQTSIFSKEWEKIYPSLIQTTALSTVPINPLVDMEWKFGVSSASNQLNTIGNVFLQIKLEVDQGSGRTKSVCFELQLSEFYAFLHEMERARASLDYLS